jgi:hypothetical protein
VGTPNLLLLYLFGFARSLIGLRHPSPVDLTRTYSSFGIDYTNVSIIGSSSTSLSSTTRIFSEQWVCCCVASLGHSTTARVCSLRRCIYIAVPCASMTVLPNLCFAIRLHKVFVLLIGSTSSSCRYPHHR